MCNLRGKPTITNMCKLSKGKRLVEFYLTPDLISSSIILVLSKAK